MSKTSGETQTLKWCLESKLEGGRVLQRVPIRVLPFRVGRTDGLELTLPFSSVSKRHAEIYLDGGDLMLRDLGSTNGTFVNRKRVTGSILREGDILHFAEFEFRLGTIKDGAEELGDRTIDHGTLAIDRIQLPQHFLGGTRQLAELMTQGMVDTAFQAIVRIPSGEILAYEVLGRGIHEELPGSPAELFKIAETVGCEAELSRLFRRNAIEKVRACGVPLPMLFLNTHPVELGTPELVESLRRVRAIAPDQELALEIHEGALAETQVMSALKRDLDRLDIRLALDDFGIGERFVQLAEVPPHYVKFDISLVKDIAEASVPKQRMMSMLMAAFGEVGAEPLAEGIETEREAEVCSRLGFKLAQGYLYAEPLTLTQLLEARSKKAAQQVESERPEQR